MSKLKKIIDIADITGSTEIEIWTDSLKVKGNLLKDKDRIEKGIVTIQNPIIKPLLGENTHSDLRYDWLNIFEDHIIAFTIVK